MCHNNFMTNKVLQLLQPERKRLLKQRACLDAQIKRLDVAIAVLGSKTAKPAKTRKMSAKARAKIAAAQKKRWALWRKKKS